MERRPAGCAENARDQNRKCSQCPQEATRRESELELESVNTEGLDEHGDERRKWMEIRANNGWPDSIRWMEGTEAAG